MPVAPVGAAGAARPAAPVSPDKPSFSTLLQARTPAPAASAPPPRPSAALSALEGVERAQRSLEGVLAAARQGRTFSAQELLGLQAAAYRAVQTVDLASKLVEQGAQSVKQALNTQV